MEGAPRSYHDRLEAGIGFRLQELPARVFSAADIDPAAQTVQLHRERRSHRGVGARQAIRTLRAYSVDQAFFDEICELRNLETLFMDRLTATELGGIGRLGSLRRLVIEGATRMENLDWVAALPAQVHALAIEHAPRVHSLEPLAALTRLKALAIEGSLHATMRVRSLAPLAALGELEYLFLAALKVDDGRLAPLQGLSRLKVLGYAYDYAPGEATALAAALPHTRCDWFERSVQVRVHTPGEPGTVTCTTLRSRRQT